jgi:hypothetical protein
MIIVQLLRVSSNLNEATTDRAQWRENLELDAMEDEKLTRADERIVSPPPLSQPTTHPNMTR